jgi:hypothetical protein
VARRYGLFERKETLEQIGELLGITRERVRQLEKVIVTRLKSQASEGKLPHIKDVEQQILKVLGVTGKSSTIANLTKVIAIEDNKFSRAQIAFLCALSPNLIVIDENDTFYQGVAMKPDYKDVKSLQKQISNVVDAIKELNKPESIENIAKHQKISEVSKVKALASLSKQITSLNGSWGLTKWPTVNPKNIRDKIYVILKENKKQMHFSEIAGKIKKSDFKRKDVTVQAIHNELIKDDRFVLVGRGIYALKEWGFKKGTVSDVIADVLKKADEPLHRDEIVKRVLKNRYVKETTILLNLQGKKQFKRVAKATYALSEN